MTPQSSAQEPLLATKGAARPAILSDWDDDFPAPKATPATVEHPDRLSGSAEDAGGTDAAAQPPDTPSSTDTAALPAAALLASHIARLERDRLLRPSVFEGAPETPVLPEPLEEMAEEVAIDSSASEVEEDASTGDGAARAAGPEPVVPAAVSEETAESVLSPAVEVARDDAAPDPADPLPPDEGLSLEPDGAAPPPQGAPGQGEAPLAERSEDETETAETAGYPATATLQPGTSSQTATSPALKPADSGTADLKPAESGTADLKPAESGTADLKPAESGTADRKRPDTLVTHAAIGTAPARSTLGPSTLPRITESAKTSGKRDLWVIAALVVLGLLAVSLIAWSVHGDLSIGQAATTENQPRIASVAPPEEARSTSESASSTALAVGSGEYLPSDTPSLADRPADQAISAESATQDSSKTQAVVAVEPRVDVVRIETTGAAIIAGVAAPHSEVIVLDKGQPIGTARADSRGEWVLLPDAPLASGDHEISLVKKIVSDSVTLPKLE